MGRVLNHPRELGIDEVYVRRSFRARRERGHGRDRESVSEAVAQAYLRRAEAERLPENAVRKIQKINKDKIACKIKQKVLKTVFVLYNILSHFEV